MTRWQLLATALIVLNLTAPLSAQTPSPAELQQIQHLWKQIRWTAGPARAAVGDQASISIPAGFQITDAAGSRLWNQINQNLEAGECAVIVPDTLDWRMSFRFDPIGRVSDDEGQSLDAAAILNTVRSNTLQGNPERQRLGYGSLFIDGWIRSPVYNIATKRLEWAYAGHSDDGNRFANFDTRILGRNGVMTVKLIADADKIEAVIPIANQLLQGFTFQTGNNYAQWQAGDKVASVGLTALITGTTTAAVAKTGLLQKLGAFFGKFIYLIGAGVAAFFWKLFHGAKPAESTTPPSK